MDADRDGLAVDRLVAVHERGVLLAVDRVPEADGVEVAEAGRQLGGGRDPHAHVLLPSRSRRGWRRARGGRRSRGGTSGHQSWCVAGRVERAVAVVGVRPRVARRMRQAAGLALRGGPAAAARVDDEDRRRLVADVLDVVRDGRVPGEVVARTELDDVVALGHPPAAATGSGGARRRGGRGRRSRGPGGAVTSRMHTSRDVPASTSVIRAPPGLGRPRPVGRAHDARRRRRVEQEPRRRARRGRPAIAASASSDGSALSFSIWRR